MKVLIDICHPAHVHFFKNAAAVLKDAGHELTVTSRDKDCTLQLLDEMGIPHRPLSSMSSGGIVPMARELWQRDFALSRVARRERPDVMLAIGGTFIAHVGALTRIPSVIFYDTENARLQNAITYPFARCIVVPRSYRGWLPRHHRKYAGYHELAYLHPTYFTPDRGIALANGLSERGPTFLIRCVSWQANHDIGERGWSRDLLSAVVGRLAAIGKVLISAEGALPQDLAAYRYAGTATALHHVLAHCRMVVGESATLASEAAVLGVPAIYAATTGRGYTDEQEKKYGLVRNVTDLSASAILEMIDAVLAVPDWKVARQALLDDTVDVTAMIVELAAEFGQRRPR